MTQRLLSHARRNWVRLDGKAVWSRIDLLDLPIDRFLNALYHDLSRELDEPARRRLDAMLWIPPPDVVPTAGPWSPQAETQAFKAVKAALGMRDPGAPKE